MDYAEHYDDVDQAELDAVNDELAQSAEEERLISYLEDNTFKCAECGNIFEIDESHIWGGITWICHDCLQMLEQMAAQDDEPIPEEK